MAASGTAAAENDDICQLPDGKPFGSGWLAAALGCDAGEEVPYSIPAQDVIRGPHSVAARLLLQKGVLPASRVPAHVSYDDE